MDGTKENENPTILNVSQLPTRHQVKRLERKGPESKYDHILYPKGDGPWGFSKSASTWSSDDEVEVEDEGYDSGEEPIDEQEIYGEQQHSPSLFSAPYPTIAQPYPT